MNYYSTDVFFGTTSYDSKWYATQPNELSIEKNVFDKYREHYTKTHKSWIDDYGLI